MIDWPRELVILHRLLPILPPAISIVKYVDLASSLEGIAWLPHLILFLLPGLYLVLCVSMGGSSPHLIVQPREPTWATATETAKDGGDPDHVGWQVGGIPRAKGSGRRRWLLCRKLGWIVMHSTTVCKKREIEREELRMWKTTQGEKKNSGN